LVEPSSCRACVRKLPLIGLAGLIANALFVAPVMANCYELIGCTDQDYFQEHQLEQLGCQPLWEVRNTIYKENGYCFHTAKAIKIFGNAGCQFDNVSDVSLNEIELHNVSAIKKVEKNKHCR
jgi:YARHG domain